MLDVPGRRKGSTGHQIDQLVQFRNQGVAGRNLGAHRPLGVAFGLALLARLEIEPGGSRAGLAAADVFADHLPVDASGARVVPTAFVPAHVMLHSRVCPASGVLLHPAQLPRFGSLRP